MNIKCIEKIISNGFPATMMDILFILTDGADSFNWNIKLPITSEAILASYMDSRMEDFRSKIYAVQYPGGIPGTIGNETLLESWQRWGENGCINSGGIVIQKIPWIDSFVYDPEKENSRAVKNIQIDRMLNDEFLTVEKLAEIIKLIRAGIGQIDKGV